MAKTFRTYLPEQNLLLPASLREWLPDDHLAYFVCEVVDELDLSGIYAVYEEDERGQPPYDPRMMTKVLLYGYCVGVFVAEDPAAVDRGRRVPSVGSGQCAGLPDHRGLSEAAPGGAERAVRADVTDGFGDGGDEAGAGGAGREQGEGERLQAQSHELRADAGAGESDCGRRWKLLTQAEAADAEEDSRYGRDRRGDELPEELQRRETRLNGYGRPSGRWKSGPGRSQEQGEGSGGSAAEKEGAVQLYRSRVTVC